MRRPQLRTLLFVASALLLTTALFSACARDPEVAKQAHLQRGKALVAEKQYRNAIIELRNALRYDPKFGEARSYLAEALLANGDRDRALLEFVRAADLLPDSVEAQLKAGNALLVAGQFTDAESRADLALRREPRLAQALLLKGHALAGLRRIDEAIKQIEEAIALNAGADAHRSLGMLQLGQGKSEAAEATFKRALQVAPQSVDAHLALAQFYWMAGRQDDAESTLLRAIELQPTHLAANRASAAFYISTARPLEAERFLKAVVEHSTEPGAPLMLANYYAATGREKEALAILAPVAADGPIGVAATLRTADIHYTLGNKEAAHEAIDAVIKKHPQNTDALVSKARFLLIEGKPQEALERTQHAIRRDPRSAAAHYTQGLAFIELDDAIAASTAFTEVLKINPQAAGAQTRLAALHLVTGKPDATVSMAEAALRNAPDSREAHLLLVKGLLGNRNFPRAESEAQLLLTRHGTWAPAHTTKAMVQFHRRNFVDAEQGFRRAIQLDPEDAEALQGLISVLVHTNRSDEGRKLLNARLAERPKSPGVLVLIGNLEIAQGNFEAAERSLSRALEVDRDYLSAYAALGRLYVQQQRLDQASARYQELAERSPRDVTAQTMVGFLHQMQNRPDEARARYEKVLAMDSRAAVAANNLAWMYAEQDTNLDMALQLAQTAKQQLPEEAGVTDTLGWVYYKKKLSTQAIQAFEEAIQLAPATPVYWYHLGLAYVQAGESIKARDALNEALKLPGFAEATEARRLLQSMETASAGISGR